MAESSDIHQDSSNTTSTQDAGQTLSPVHDQSETFNVETQTSTESEATIRERVNEFCTDTTAHGLSHIATTGSKTTRVVWILVILAAFTGTIFHLQAIIRQYLEYGTTETVSIVDKHKPVWPAITICNAQPFPFTDLATVYELYVGYGPDFNGTINDQVLLGLFGALFAGNVSSEQVETYLRTVPNDILSDNIEDYTFIDIFFNAFNAITSANWVFWNYDSTNIGHKIYDMFPICIFGTPGCNYFNLYKSPEYFKCYTFDYGRQVLVTGQESGFIVTVFLDSWMDAIGLRMGIDTNQYIDKGIRAIVEIHESGTMPNPGNSGLSVPAGFSTQLSIKQHVHEKIPHPYSDCSQDKRLPEFPQYRYSRKSCYEVCKLMYIYKTCHCLISGFPKPDSLSGVEYCAYVPPNDINGLLFAFRIWCQRRAYQNFKTDMCGWNQLPSCNEPCSYKTYETSYSNSLWPSSTSLKGYLYDIRETESPFFRYYNIAYSKSINDTYDNNSDPELYDLYSHERRFETFRKNFARLDVYFEDLSVVEHKAAKAMTLGDLLANTGGTMGLWIGISVITVVEFISFPFQLLYHCLKTRWIRRNTNSIQPKSSERS